MSSMFGVVYSVWNSGLFIYDYNYSKTTYYGFSPTQNVAKTIKETEKDYPQFNNGYKNQGVWLVKY